MTIDVSSEYYSKIAEGGNIRLRVCVGSDDYSDRLLKGPKIKKTVERLTSTTVTVPFANTDQEFNNFYLTAASLNTDLKIELGYSTNSSFITDSCNSDNTADWTQIGVSSLYWDNSDYIFTGGQELSSSYTFQPFQVTSGYTYAIKIQAKTHEDYTITHLDSDDQGDLAFGVWGDGNFIYLANYTGGLHTYSVDGSGFLTHIDFDDQGDIAFGVWGDGNFIYLANGDGGIHVYSVDGSGFLTHIDFDDQGGAARGVWGDGNFIYLANYTDGIHVYSVDGSGFLTHIDSDDQGGEAYWVWGDGNFIYLANGTGGIHVYSVDGSGFLTHIDSDDQGGIALGVWGDGNFIYLANGDGGIHVYSVDGSGFLTHIDFDDQGGEAYGIWGDGNFIYLANHIGGLHTYSVDGDGFLTHIDSDNQGDRAYRVWGDGNFIYLANGDGGLHTYITPNISFPTDFSGVFYDGNSVRFKSISPVSSEFAEFSATWTARSSTDSGYMGFGVGSGEIIDIDNIKLQFKDIEYASFFKGKVSAVKYSKTQCSIIAKDLIQGLTQYTIGESGAAVEYSGTIPTDIIWDLCTCYGGLDSTASTSNADIDYTSFLEVAGIYSADNVTLDAYFDGQKITSALDSVLTMTDARVYATGADKLKFSRLEAATSADITLTPSDILDLGIDIDADEIINKSLTYYNYSVESNYFENYATYTNTDSQNSYGIYTYALADTNVWFTSANDADIMAARKAVLFGDPPIQYSVESTLLGGVIELTDTVRFVDSFFNVTSETAWRVVEQTIDLNAGTVENVLDSALTISPFYLDVNYLDSDERLL